MAATPDAVAAVEDPSNLSNLYFSTHASLIDHALPFVGPVSVRRRDVIAGRGLVTTRPVRAGELLFCTPPTVHADPEIVAAKWIDGGQEAERWRASSSSSILEKLTENVLLDAMQATYQDALQGNAQARARVNSFMMLEGAASDGKGATVDSIDALLGQNDPGQELSSTIPERTMFRAIIHHNAFGPDSRLSYAHVHAQWQQNMTYRPFRLLGLYPLAAMLNHACVANVVRCYVGELMIVHAATNLAVDTELVWSYVPPTRPFAERAHLLQQRGFDCHCARCTIEHAAYNDKSLSANLLAKLDSIQALNQSLPELTASARKLRLAVRLVEDKILPHSGLTNELRRYIRLGLTQLYINYLNATLQVSSDPDTKQNLLPLCSQLHVSFVTGHYASTEHLSLLHLCYELSSSDSTTTAARPTTFWMEQLKRAHLVRYGYLGGHLETVRRVLQHTRRVLRTAAGLESAEYSFV